MAKQRLPRDRFEDLPSPVGTTVQAPVPARGPIPRYDPAPPVEQPSPWVPPPSPLLTQVPPSVGTGLMAAGRKRAYTLRALRG